jgi:hypothetical protein
MTRGMLALLLMGLAGCGGSLGSSSGIPDDPPAVDFARYNTYNLWPCGPNGLSQPGSCDGLVRKYVAALADDRICDSHVDSCVRRPIGGPGPGDAILCNCTMSVNAGSTQTADAVLTDFYAAGCTIMCCSCLSPPPP